MIYITSDLHFGHDKNFLYEPRGFSSIKEHDETIIKNWNEIVNPDDSVFVLGDLMLGNDIDYGVRCVNQLNGDIYLIRGNHDTDNKIKIYYGCIKNLVGPILCADMIKYGKYQFYLSHYPTSVGNYDDEKHHNKFYCLCGHTHTKDKWKDFHTMKAYHVELDAHNNYPVSIDEIIDDIKKQNSLNEN